MAVLVPPARADLARDPSLACAREILERYAPPCAEQARVRTHILAFLDAHPSDAHERACAEGHLTGSCLLLDARRERVLLTHHKKLDRWLQLGGHADGDANLRGVAWREACEEAGFTPAAISSAPIDLDVHPIPARPGEPRHDHLDLRYLAVAPKGAEPACSDESHEVRWMTPEEARALGLDASLERLLALAFDA